MTILEGDRNDNKKGQAIQPALLAKWFFPGALLFFPVRLHAKISVNVFRIAEIGHVDFREGR